MNESVEKSRHGTDSSGPEVRHHSAAARLRAFSNLGYRLSFARTQRDAIWIILDIADQFFGWDACTFDSYSADEDIVESVIIVDRIDGERRDVESVAKRRKPTPRMREVIEKGATIILREEPVKMPADSVPIGDQSRPSAALMFVPIRWQDEIVGLLSVQSYTPHAYSSDDLELLQALADHGAGAIERIQAEEKVQALNRHLEERVQERTAALVATVGELEAFSYSVSHDMRAPLRAMDGFARLLLEEYTGKVLDQTAVDYLERICRSSVRLDELIRDVLTYAQVLRGGVVLRPVNMVFLVRDVLDAHPQWCAPSCQIDVIEPIPLVLGNEALLSQCVSNLLSNAVKFVASGVRPQVKIRAESTGVTVRIRFEDNGLGIAPEHHGRIFKMFERLHPSTEFEGTGIGLTIVRKAVERMKGSVGFESTLGKGSTFWIQLGREG